VDFGFGFLLFFVHLGFCLGGDFFGMNVSCWFLVCFSRFSVFVVFWGELVVGSENREFSGERKGLMIVGEFLVFGKALLTLRVRGS